MKCPTPKFRRLIVTAIFALSPATYAAPPDGMALVLTPSKGNCIACHQLGDNPEAGNLGPILSGIKKKYPDRKQLQQLLWDPTQRQPNTIMPPFGKHHILNQGEIEKVIDYLYTL